MNICSGFQEIQKSLSVNTGKSCIDTEALSENRSLSGCGNFWMPLKHLTKMIYQMRPLWMDALDRKSSGRLKTANGKKIICTGIK